MAEELGSSEVAVAGAYSVALLTGGLAATTAGRALDRWGARSVMTAAGALAAAAFLSLSAVRGVVSLYLVWAAIGVARAGVLYEPAFAAVTSWFSSERDRLRALLVVTSVGGLASTVFTPLTAALATRGWRTAVVLLAGVLALLVLPLHASLTTTAARSAARGPRRGGDVGVLSAVFALHAFCSAGIAVHLASQLMDGGLALADAAALSGLLGVSQVAGRLLSPRLRALARAEARLSLLLVAQALSLVALIGGAPLLGVLLFGAANGLVTLERATIVAERFGAERYGEHSGRIARAGLIARAAAPLALGAARAHAGPQLAFFSLAALLLFASAIFFCVHLADAASSRT